MYVYSSIVDTVLYHSSSIMLYILYYYVYSIIVIYTIEYVDSRYIYIHIVVYILLV